MDDAQRTSIELAAFAIVNAVVVSLDLDLAVASALNLSTKAFFSWAWNRWKPVNK